MMKGNNNKRNIISKNTHNFLLKICYARLDSLRNVFINNISFVVVVIMISFFCFASVSKASTEIYFQNDTKEITQGDSFGVFLKASSDKSINVVDGTVLYDKDKLQIKEIKKDNSILSLWTKEPIFDNKIGELSFTGGMPDGFAGKDGEILSITFLAKKTGTTTIGFQDIFSVYANDGLGTQINPWHH